MTNMYTTQKKTVDFINKQMDKGALKNLLAQIYLEFGGAKTATLANTLKNLGYHYATKSGVTISISDLSVPPIKQQLLKEADEEIEKSTKRYLKGEITEVERYTKVIDTWSETTAKLTEQVVKNFDRLNPVYMMAFSGARGNLSQVSQLVGMRGLMADAQGQIIDLPIRSNFKEGLSVTEYIISSYGARKGLVDTALKTADSGYLTRRLVDVAQDVIIRDHDCHGKKHIKLRGIYDGDTCIVPLVDRLLGRTIAQDIVDADGKVVVESNTTLDRKDIKKIQRLDEKIWAEIEKEGLDVRSGLTCELEYGVCQKCYGWAMTTQKLVDVGESIGIIAAQSIGEPGTQLTMRTFHTGGVFKGSGAMKYVKADEAGEVVTELKGKTQEERTRHGDVVQKSMLEFDIEIKGAKSSKKYHIPTGARIMVQKGDKVAKDDNIAIYEPVSQGDGSRLTEKATKDITSDLSGEVVYQGFTADEKKDRQGNISRTANKSGVVWVLGGDVYNLPGGSKVQVKDGQAIKEGEKLAETSTICEHGGEVRVGEDLVIEEVKFEGKKIKKIVSGKELTIVIASIMPSNASFEQTKKEQIWTVDKTGEKYIVKSPVDTTVENGMIIAELISEDCSVTSSGEIKYVDVEVDENQIITKAGNLVFIPEEVHQLNKESTLKMVESGTYVTAGTEIVKDVYCHLDGIVEIKEYNDVIHEVTIRPGEIHQLANVSELKVEEGEVIKKGTLIAEGIKAKETSIVTIMDSEMDDLDIEDLDEEIDTTMNLEEDNIANQPIQILVRPVQVIKIQPKDVSINFDSTDELIGIVPVTQLQYKDGARVRNLDGATLVRTSLVLQMQGYLSHLKGMVELNEKGELKIVVLDKLIVRRELEGNSKLNDSLQTELLVKNGETIDPKTPVAKTCVLALNDGVASIKNESEDARRLLLVCDSYEEKVKIKAKAVVKAGQFIKQDDLLTEDEADRAPVSGQVVSATKSEIVIRAGRPYLISPGTMLQVAQGSLVLRGDMLVTLVYERQKTGDIVQGLPKVEELLEGRKPKDCAILAEYDGTLIIEEDEAGGLPKLYLESEEGDKTEIKYPIDLKPIGTSGNKIKKGQPLTTGSLNPHDVMRLCGPEVAQQYLVDEVQRVYRSQGVEIADKHVEIIVRQMTKKVKIVDAGDTNLLPGELVEVQLFEKENEAVQANGGQVATCEYMLLGITKASLNTESFISAASFQETTRILTEAAVDGKKDLLRGLKENVIIGRLIPAGTGFYHLTHANEEKDKEAQRRAAQRNQARKPSAILEEIEGMFGAPEFSVDDDTIG
ncbi:MAG: DNA-directed RNA polymerase subunit beta'' [Candidatus Melainabacteria bacterium]|nr:MAG: DNA-directed RNA polymerase subunit beta'' [Candidatus Melainabacteria bacterium]